MAKLRFRITITTTIEYNVKPKYYPHCNSTEEMLKADIKNAKDDPFIYMDLKEANTEVKGEIVDPS